MNLNLNQLITEMDNLSFIFPLICLHKFKKENPLKMIVFKKYLYFPLINK